MSRPFETFERQETQEQAEIQMYELKNRDLRDKLDASKRKEVAMKSEIRKLKEQLKAAEERPKMKKNWLGFVCPSRHHGQHEEQPAPSTGDVQRGARKDRTSEAFDSDVSDAA